MTVAERLFKFFMVGGVTTLFAITLYAILLLGLNANLFLAYPLVFILSVSFSYVVNARLNYRIATGLRTYFQYLRSYAVGFVAGFMIISVCKALAVPLADFWIAMLSIPLRFAITFFLADRVMMAEGGKNAPLDPNKVRMTG